MAGGVISRLFGASARTRGPADTNPHPGIGGVSTPPGPAGQTGFPGSTGQTRTFQGNNPRAVKVRADTNTGFEQQLGDQVQVRSASYRGDVPGAATANPRSAGLTGSRQPVLTELMQATPGTFYGGPTLRTGPGNQTAGGVPLSGAAAAGGHSQRETTTPWTHAQPEIGTDVPGSQNVRNTRALRYKAVPGQVHTYSSASRGDLPPVNRGGQATDGNVNPHAAVTSVSVPSRFVFDNGGNQTWSVDREMPYGGRGDGARGADLNGQRYYATGQATQFWNAGQGDYGIARASGGDHKRPVSFQQPAPWTANFYDTTQGVADETTAQAPNMIYVSPTTGRATNRTGRTS
jgi:hypothetical protein